MVTKAITQSDLNALEKSIKLEINKEQTELRHEDRKKLSDCIWVVDTLKTDSALSKQSHITMVENQEELKEMMKEWFKEIKEDFKSMYNIFVTKEEHKANKVEIESIKATHWKIITWVVGTVWTIVIAFFWLIIKTLWIK